MIGNMVCLYALYIWISIKSKHMLCKKKKEEKKKRWQDFQHVPLKTRNQIAFVFHPLTPKDYAHWQRVVLGDSVSNRRGGGGVLFSFFFGGGGGGG